MTKSDNAVCATWYDRSYGQGGYSAQRLYPNEELLRFFGRHYFSLAQGDRRSVRVLEVGCGSGANLWLIAREGFEAHGIDLSSEGVALCRKMLAHWDTSADVRVADMTSTPYPDDHFDVVVDVFSSYCLDERGLAHFLPEVARILRRGGRFFSYAPSKLSTAFRDPGPSRLIDASTLDGIRRQGAPFTGNLYPFRFISSEEYQRAVESCGMAVRYLETVGRSYGGKEYFEFVVIVGEC